VRIYVGNINFLATIPIVESWFVPFGILKDIYMPLSKDSVNNVNRGYAFVSFDSEHAAARAIRTLHQQPDPIWGRALVVQPACERPEKKPKPEKICQK